MKRTAIVTSALCFALGAASAFAEDRMGHEPMGKPHTRDKMDKTDKKDETHKMGKMEKADKMGKMDKMERPGAM